MNNIIFIAPPAAGKGTISDYLVKNYNYAHLSTGELLRAEVKKGTELGQEIDALISKGNFVSDELIIKLVRAELENNLKGKTFILDGFPRNLAQAEKLDEMLEDLQIKNVVPIYLEIDKEEATKRVLGRIICPKCGRSYNLYNELLKPKVENICDDCDVELASRSDDTKETFEVRFDTYMKSTYPVIEYYKNKNSLVTVSATSNLETIYEDVIEAAKSTNLTRVKEVKND